MSGPTVVVLAKEPMPGLVKTRLTPPCTPAQAAGLAEAALADTLDAVLALADVRPVLALRGRPGPWCPPKVPVLPQRGHGLDQRIAVALDDAVALAGGPVLLVGMDTPQLTAHDLADAHRQLCSADAVLGDAADGGWWLLGLHAPDPALLLGVPMSASDTGARQRERLRAHGLRVASAPVLRDVDTVADCAEVAALAPGGRFAATWREVCSQLERGAA